MKETKSILKVVGLSLAYGRRTILEGVNLEVRPGEFWFFLGPNGTGKTTLLRGILELLSPKAGELWLHHDLAGREQIGFVPQRGDPNLTLPTTVREFVLLGLVGIRLNRRKEAEQISWALEKVGLGGMGGRDYRSLSGGQKQRTLLARALVRRPSLLILDEPTNGLDLPTEEIFLHLLVELNQEDQITLLFVTHDLALAARYGTHIALFHSGHVQAGPAFEILTPKNLEQAYGLPLEVDRGPSGSVSVRSGKEGGPS